MIRDGRVLSDVSWTLAWQLRGPLSSVAVQKAEGKGLVWVHCHLNKQAVS